MKLLFRTLCCLLIATGCIFLVQGCKKAPFKSGIGLFSVKQYHVYTVLSAGDTAKLADARISISALDNNYLSWNGITFHIVTSSDSIATYIKDSSVSGTYQIIYTLTYLPKTDYVTVVGNSTVN